jgi:hypothetical protein
MQKQNGGSMLDKFWSKIIQLLYAFVKSYAEQHSLDGYSEMEKAKFTAGYDVDIAENDKQVYQFIVDSIELKIRDKKLLLGKITEALACRIEDEIGINLQGYSLAFYANDIKHAFNRHSNDRAEKRRNPPQRAITARDISRFVDIVTEYSSVKAERYNCVSFQKNINGMATIITVHSCGKRTLSLKTMFIEI